MPLESITNVFVYCVTPVVAVKYNVLPSLVVKFVYSRSVNVTTFLTLGRLGKVNGDKLAAVGAGVSYLTTLDIESIIDVFSSASVEA
jgi:hypothetical protein